MITVRSEQVSDYHRIAEINALAFYPYLDRSLTSTFVSEFPLVDALRHGGDFDPDLSLVAEVNGVVAGHALFYPYRVLLGGDEERAVSLGPIAVAPSLQQKGIGTQLILEGHRRAARKGYAFSFLLGHPSYYPRFGYLTNMFGQCGLEVRAADIPAQHETLGEKLVQPGDVGWLASMWRAWFKDVDLAIYPGESVLDWLSHAEEIMALIVERDGERIGYIRFVKHDPAQIKMFLAQDEASVPLVLGHLLAKLGDKQVDRVLLPLHPGSQAVKDRFKLPYEARVTASEAAMIKVLDGHNQAVTTYCESVISGSRLPGLVIWPPAMEYP